MIGLVIITHKFILYLIKCKKLIKLECLIKISDNIMLWTRQNKKNGTEQTSSKKMVERKSKDTSEMIDYKSFDEIFKGIFNHLSNSSSFSSENELITNL